MLDIFFMNYIFKFKKTLYFSRANFNFLFKTDENSKRRVYFNSTPSVLTIVFSNTIVQNRTCPRRRFADVTIRVLLFGYRFIRGTRVSFGHGYFRRLKLWNIFGRRETENDEKGPFRQCPFNDSTCHSREIIPLATYEPVVSPCTVVLTTAVARA